MTDSQSVKELYLIYKHNVLAFVEDFLQHYLTYKTPDFHKEILETVSKEQRVALAAPRGFAKSTLVCVFYVLHSSLFLKHKDITLISASESLAIEWLRRIRRELETNPMIIKFFGDLRSEKWTENHLVLSNGVNIRARGAGGQIRGFRPDLIVLDDIETDESVSSEEQRNKLRDWIFKACLNTLLPEGKFIIIGTIISPLALLEEMLTSNNDWVKRKYRAYKDGIQEEGHELWGSLWTHARLQARKAEIGTFSFASEFMNDPVSNETAPIKQHQIRYWKELPQQYSCVIAVDPAYSEDDRADYKVAALIGLDQNMNRYLISYVRTHSPTGEFIDAILNMWLQSRDKCTGIGLPHSGGDKEFFSSFMRKCEERKLYPPVTELKNSFTQNNSAVTKRNKMGRIIASLQPLFESGKYYINESHSDARDELLALGYSRHDDLVDALSYGEQIISPVFYEVPGQANYSNQGLQVNKNRIKDYGY